jgi:hypothetical protein
MLPEPEALPPDPLPPDPLPPDDALLLCDEEAAGAELPPEWLCAACDEPPQAVTSAMTAPNIIARRRREVMGLLPVEWMYQLSGGFTDFVPVRFTATAARH